MILQFFKIFFLGIWDILSRLGIFFKKLFFELPFWERIFLASALLQGLMLARPWRGYEIDLSADTNLSHGIYTDDFLWFAIAFTCAGLPTLVMMMRSHADTSETRFTFFTRIGALSVISVLYLLSIIDPGRIAPTSEASFTWVFYLFGLLLPVTWVSGIRGVVHYAQSS
ncbi:MAG: hypothetical protein KDK41_11360 [Leptospiraceae bacterium]|nr:hypothetical protein [Leptospiraceae bacterium]